MRPINPFFKDLEPSYLFSEIARRKSLFNHLELINLGIGDISLPLAPTIGKEICDAVMEMTTPEGKRGYGPELGYPFLKKALLETALSSLNLTEEEVIISDGITPAICYVRELFADNITIGIPDLTYPLYSDVNTLWGNRSRITFLPCLPENDYLPVPPDHKLDLVYLCTPSNPTGTAMTRKALKKWISYAHTFHSTLLIDAAYAPFIRSPDVPKSIFEIEGSKHVAIEFHSFSKGAGFTGLRAGYTLLPKELGPLLPLYNRIQTTKSNGIAYPIQRGASAALSGQGLIETTAQLNTYLESTTILRNALIEGGLDCFGGTDSPYIWWKFPHSMTSWDFFDYLLAKHQIVTIPGSGFGPQGEGYVRLSGFITPDTAIKAASRLIGVFA